MGLGALTGRAKPVISPEELRASRPVRNPLVEAREGEDGGIVLVAPLDTQGKGIAATLARWMHMPDTKQFELEPVGAFVWGLCDGEHSFEAITKRLRERYKMNRLEAEAALTAFLRMLGQRRLISLANRRKQ